MDTIWGNGIGSVSGLADRGSTLTQAGDCMVSSGAFPQIGYPSLDGPSPIYGLPYQISLVALFVLYCLVIYYYRSSIFSLFKSMRNKAYAKKVYTEQTYFFRNFLRLMNGMGIWVYSMVIVKAIDWYGKPIGADLLPEWSVEWSVVFVAAAVAITEGYQRLAIGLISAVTRCTDLTGPIIYLRRILNAVAVILLTPLLLLSLTPGLGGTVFVLLAAALILLLVCHFLFRSYIVFVGQEISLLNWFLYLCVVEWFPVSFFILAAIRNF